MKKLVALLACTVIATSAFAQGTVNFTILKPTKQILSDAAGAKLEGAWAQLYAGKAADNLSAVGSPVALYEGKKACLLYTSPSPRDGLLSRMPSSA